MDAAYADREQSWIKHFALQKYLDVATKIIGSSRNFSFVDCCAGPWESKSPSYEDTSFGIAIKMLRESRKWLKERNKLAQFKALLIEAKAEPFQKLSAFAEKTTDSEVTVRAENWDFREHIADIVSFVSTPRSFGFIFIDPTGWTPAEVGALGPLLSIQPGEVLINFMSSFIVRFLHDPNTHMDEILGPDYRALRSLSHEEQEDEVVRRYCDLLRRQGQFQYVCALPIMKADVDAIHFYLIYGTRHEKGVEVFKQVEKKTLEQTHLVRAQKQQANRSNMDLFQPDVLYRREARYQRLAARQSTNAKKALHNLLAKQRIVDYDACWAESLQFPTVQETNLRGWLAELETTGRIRIDGRLHPKDSLKRHSNHRITWLDNAPTSGR
jgi:three-Cys-motif partner protein